MSTKRLAFWERNAGAVAVGVASLLVVGLLARMFWPSERPTPAEVDARLHEQATALAERLAGEAPAPIDLSDPPSARELLARSLDGRVTRSATLSMPAPALGPSVEGVEHGHAVLFAEPELPPPGQAVALSYLGTLADGVTVAHPALAAHLAAPEPPDLVWNTAAARVDLAELRRRFAEAPDGLQAAPSAWSLGHRGVILDVVVERQEMTPGGAWSPSVTLEAIPGAVTLRAELEAIANAAARDDLLGRALDPATALDIVQPPFYPLRSGAWAPPHLAAAAGPDEAPQLRELRFLVARRASLIRYLEARYGVRYEEDRPPAGDREQGDGGRGVPGPPPDGFGPSPGIQRRGRPGSGAGDGEAITRRIEQIREIDTRIAELEAHLGLAAADVAAAPLDLAGAEEVWVWAHDLTARPGFTYRYAVSLRLYNPFFGRLRSLVPEQAPLAEDLTRATPRGPWSAPVTAERFTRVWITRAQAPSGPSDLGRATAEVDRWFDGRLWRGVFSVEPGDLIGGPRLCRPSDGADATLVDFSSGLAVMDILGPPDPYPGVLLQDVRSGAPQGLRDARADGQAARAAGGTHCGRG